MFDREHNLILINTDDIVLDEHFRMDLYHKGNGYEWVIKEYQWGWLNKLCHLSVSHQECD